MQANEATCAKCGMTQGEWRGNDGAGYESNGQTYCCQGCATDSTCTCRHES